MSSTKESSISSITPLTSENYRSWADDMKSWLQLHGLWRLVSGLERKPAGRAEVRDTASNVVTPAVNVDEDKLERWEIKAEKAAGALKTAMSPDVRVLIRDGEDDPLFIWDTLQKSFMLDSGDTGAPAGLWGWGGEGNTKCARARLAPRWESQDWYLWSSFSSVSCQAPRSQHGGASF